MTSSHFSYKELSAKNYFILLMFGAFSSAFAAQSTVTHFSEQYSFKNAVDYRLGFDLDNLDKSLSRLSFLSTLEGRIDSHWSLNVSGRVELSDDDVNLGETSNYSEFSNPLIDNTSSRLELDKAMLTWKHKSRSLVIGKQTTPWGLLDGLQVTDRFDAIRRRDFVFSDQRPERIARWGIRWRQNINFWNVDVSIVLDPTVSQYPNVGDVFQFRAKRYTGGFDSTDGSLTDITLVQSSRSVTFAQSTYGLKLRHAMGDGEISFITFRGPDTDAVLAPLNNPENDPNIRIQTVNPIRSLYGINYDVSLGETVLRLEAAHIPNQAINTLTSVPLSYTQRPRTLFGAGLDWNAPGDVFFNIQWMLDYISVGDNQLFRPITDNIVTMRMHKTFQNDLLLTKLEIISSLNQNDGTIRPIIKYDVNDNLALQIGIDFIFGNEQGQFGQFEDASRSWTSITYTL